MKRQFIIAVGSILLLAALQGMASAVPVTLLVDNSADLYTTSIGNYAAVAGTPNAGQGNTGNLLDISTAQNGSLVVKSLPMSTLVNILKGGSSPLSSTDVLVFGLDINETGSANGSNTLYINSLTMTFNNTPFGTKTYNLGSQIIEGAYYGSGASAGEVLFQVNLGFDFLAQYSSISTDIFSISSNLTNGDDGGDRYFLSSGFSANPPVPLTTTPEPATMALMGMGLAGLLGLRRKKSA